VRGSFHVTPRHNLKTYLDAPVEGEQRSEVRRGENRHGGKFTEGMGDESKTSGQSGPGGPGSLNAFIVFSTELWKWVEIVKTPSTQTPPAQLEAVASWTDKGQFWPPTRSSWALAP